MERGRSKRRAETHVVSYVVDVGKPLLPARVVRFLLDDQRRCRTTARQSYIDQRRHRRDARRI